METPTKPSTPRRVNTRTPGWDSPLSPIDDRLAYLHPTKELLDFYRQKMAQFDSENEELMQMLEKYREVAEDQHKLQREIRQREGEIGELQNALSDMQVILYQEREQSLRLYAENDRLKIRELEDRKKIQHLLTMMGPHAGDVTYFHREPPHKVTIKQKTLESRLEENLSLRPPKSRSASTRKDGARRTRSSDGLNAEMLEQYKYDNQTLLLQVEALQAQMEEQARLAKEQVDALMEDRRIKTEEAEAQQQRDQQRFESLTEKLKQTQNLLHENTRDFLQLKFDTRNHEKSWMVEKDQLLRELNSYQNRQRRAGHSGSGQRGAGGSAATPHPRPKPTPQQREELKLMQEDLKQAHRLADMYREQCMTMEAELSRIKEEGDVGKEIFKARSEKMAKRLQLMTQRCEALEKRRALELEGFKTDLKHLRQKLKEVEKQLFKVTLSFRPNQDLAALHEIHQTNTRTKKFLDELMYLKAKIYGLENELRFC